MPLALLAQRPGDSVSAVPYLPEWNFMSLSSAGIDSFLLDHPTWDGRGVMVLIFDTGIDPSIPGLQLTSTGEQKVIDLVDVSGSNVVECVAAERDDEQVAASGLSMTLTGYRSLVPAPVANGGGFYLGVMDEARYKNSTVRDFDGDGVSESKFGVLLYQAADGWRVVVDANADGSLVGEKSLRNYRQDYETMRFPQANDFGDSPVTLGASIDTLAKKVVFHYDMNGHGTHVAGIAAGRSINGEEGFNGVAPGAQLISVKFSSDPDDDLTIAGTMKRAYEYAARLADSLAEVNVPVVVNMSFGIGSAYEGQAVIEKYLNELLPQHPNLYIVTSAGNEGPGLSTIGIPAAATRLISVGAVLPSGIGRDSYGVLIDRDVLWDFSSRGGEVDKPDVVAPGTAISTITRFAYDMRASGTSMASPYTAGVVALLLSALKQEFPGWIPGQALIRRALRVSAVPMEEYTIIEQGGGLVNVRRAYDLLRSWKRSGFANDVQEYRIETFSPNYPDGEGPTAFWRSGYVPDEEWRQDFTIYREAPFVTESGGEDAPFFRAYKLEPTVPWMQTVQKTVYIRDGDPATVEVLYDREQLKEPGLYSGKVVARRQTGKRKPLRDEIEFELVNTVIVPYRFSPDKNYSVSTGEQKVDAGGSKRFYFAPPSGAAALTFTLSVPKGSSSHVFGAIADKYGATDNYLPQVKGKERAEASSTISLEKIGDGVIEVIIHGDMFEGNGGESTFTLTAKALMIDVSTEVVDHGEVRELRLSAYNSGVEPIDGSFEYTLKGYSRTIMDTLRGERYRRPITLGAHDGALWVAVRFPPEEYMKSTDIMLQLVDSSGQVQAEQPYNSPEEWVFLPNFFRDGVERGFFLDLVFGLANELQPNAMKVETDGSGTTSVWGDAEPDDIVIFEIIEKHVRPTDFIKLGSYSTRTLYPYIRRTFTDEMPELEGGIPAGFHGLGELRFTESENENVRFEMEFPVPN